MIYFIGAENSRLIKIGYSDSDPDGRLVIMQTGSPVALTRIALMEGNRVDEGEIHSRFRSSRSHGEWFRDTVKLRAFIERKAVPWDGPVIRGTTVPRRVAADWRDMLMYMGDLPERQRDIEELWPRINGVKIDVYSADCY